MRINCNFCLLVSLFLLGVAGCNSEDSQTDSDVGSDTRLVKNEESVKTNHPDDTTETNDQGEPGKTSSESNESTVAKSQPKKSSNGTLEITFDDIDLPIQEDMVFRPFMMTAVARDLNGKRVRISGYMLPDSKQRGIKEFVLLKNTECKFGPGGAADHLISITMKDGDSTYFREDAIAVEGTLTINPYNGPDGNTWKIFDLACDKVSKFRPRR